MEEIYKNLNSPKSKEFEKLLNTEFSKSQISEGKIADGIITKITNKLVYVELPGAKSEGTLDFNEMKLLKEEGELKVGSKISVLIVRLEDKKGDLISLADAQFKYTGPNGSDTIWSASGKTVNGIESKLGQSIATSLRALSTFFTKIS